MTTSRLDYAEQDDLHPSVHMSAPEDAITPEHPLPVVVEGPIATTTAATQFGSYATVVIPASGVAMILPQDPNREYAYISSPDAPIVISTSKEMAQSPNNQVTNVPNPQGYYLAQGGTTPAIRHNEMIWAANTSTSNPARVSLIIERGNVRA